MTTVVNRAKLPCRDLVLFYATCIRSILVCAAPVFFYALPKLLRVWAGAGPKKGIIDHLPQSVLCMTRHLMKLVFQPLRHIARTQSCEKVFKAALGNKDNKLWRKVFPLWNEFKAQRELGAWLTIKLGKTRLKWQLACGEEPSLLRRTGIWPLTGTAVDKTELNLVPTAFILQRIKQQ